MKNDNLAKQGQRELNTVVYFAVILSNIEGVGLSPDTIKRHVSYLKELDKAGKLILAGPFLDHPSALIVLKAADISEATAIAKEDPFITEGVRTFEVRSWLMANSANNYLL